MKFNLFLFITALSTSSAWDSSFATTGAHVLEDEYIQDCKTNTEPHGYYGAFLQPCEFAFFQSNVDNSDGTDACESGTLIDTPVPMHWIFNMTKHYYEDVDWEHMSSDDFTEITNALMLWPDQCVGVTPRCYAINDVYDSLSPLFSEHAIPMGATHVRVDCRGDAVAVSSVVYAFADRFEKSMPTIIAWLVTVVLLFTASTMWCLYGCCYLCVGRNRSSSRFKTPKHAEYIVLKDHDVKYYTDTEAEPQKVMTF